MRLKSWFVSLWTQIADGEAQCSDTLEITAATREGAMSIALANRVVMLNRRPDGPEYDKLVHVDVTPMGTDGG